MLKISGTIVMVGSVMCLLGTGVCSPASALDRRILLRNNTDEAVIEFYASNVGSDDWEEDILGPDRFLPSGNAVIINIDDGTGYCRFDFKTVFSDGSNVIRRDVNVCEVTSYTVSSR